jgi:hypothetical protein
MTLKMSDVAFKGRLPEVPAAMPVVGLKSASLDDRQAAIKRLGEHLKLDRTRTAQLDHATIIGNERGDIHYFHASGGMFARDATAAKAFPNELRKWEGAERRTDGTFALKPDAAKRLLEGTRGLLEPIGLLGREVSGTTVQLEQVAQFDAKGRQLDQGAGQAAIKFAYAIEGVPARGAGAKTLAFADPASGDPRITDVFHGWRAPAGSAANVRLGSLGSALAAGLLTDPELDLYHAAGHSVTVTRIELVYLALPVFVRQAHLFPAFEIEGVVSEGKKGISFNFGRYHHAATPQAYAAADLAGSYLMTNPDGLNPLPRRPTRAEAA